MGKSYCVSSEPCSLLMLIVVHSTINQELKNWPSPMISISLLIMGSWFTFWCPCYFLDALKIDSSFKFEYLIRNITSEIGSWLVNISTIQNKHIFLSLNKRVWKNFLKHNSLLVAFTKQYLFSIIFLH